MAFAASTVWEIQTGGSDTANGGGFDPANANFAGDLTTDANTGNTASPVVSSASYNFAAGDVGHWLFVKSGTNWVPGWYQIASVASNKATLTASVGSGVLYLGATVYNTAAGVAAVGTPTGGTWGIDYSQTTAVRLTYTDMVIGVTTTQFTSVANPVGKNLVGNIISVTSGTGFTVQRVQVVSTSTITATCDKSLGTTGSTGGNGGLGGCLASPGQAGAVKIAGNTVYGKAGTYTVTGSANTSGGPVSDATSGSGSVVSRWIGYTSVRGDLNGTIGGTRPTIAAGANTLTLFATGGTFVFVDGWSVTGTGRTSIRGFSPTGSSVRLHNCKAAACDNTGFFTNPTSLRMVLCEADGCSVGYGGGNGFWAAESCRAHGCTGNGFAPGANGCALIGGCVADGNGAAGVDCGLSAVLIDRMVSYGNTTAGFLNVGAYSILSNCVGTGNAGQQFAAGTGSANARLYNCAAKADGSGATDIVSGYGLINFVTLTTDPFVNAAGNDFTLNNTAGGGALLRAAGFPSTLTGLTGTSYPDVGAFQHQDAVAGGLLVAGGMVGGMRS